MSYSNEPQIIKAFNQSFAFQKTIKAYAEAGYPNAENLVYAFYYRLSNKSKRWKTDEPNLAGWVPLVLSSFNTKHITTIREKLNEFEDKKDLAIMVCSIAFAEYSLECYDSDHQMCCSVLPDLWDLPGRKENQGLLFNYQGAEREIELSARYGLPSRASERIVENTRFIEKDLEFIKQYLDSDHSNDARVAVVQKIWRMLRPDKGAASTSRGKGAASRGLEGIINDEMESTTSLDECYKSMSMPDIAQVVAALGYMQQAKSRVKTKSKEDISKQEKGLELGSDITKILPEEFSRAPIDFCLSFAESKLWQRASISTKSKKGDFFALFDASGSMGNNLYNIERAAWGKAFILTAADVVTKTKGRKIHFIPFTGNVWKNACFCIDGSKESQQKLLAFDPTGGSTNWGNPLYWAINQMREQKDRDVKQKCDVLYITDADGFFNDGICDVQELKTEMNFEIHVVLINDDKDSENCLRPFADKVINIAQLITPEAIAEAAQSLIVDYE